MDNNEEQKSKIGDLAKKGLKTLFDKLPTSTKLKVVGIMAAIVVVFLLIIIILGSVMGPLMEVRDKINDFFKGTTDQASDYASMDEYNFYKKFSDINIKFGDKIDGPLLLATLFYSLDDDSNSDPTAKCTNANGDQVGCTSGIGINYYGKATELNSLVAYMLDIEQTTYACIATTVPGVTDPVYTMGDKIGTTIMDSGTVIDVLALSTESCSPGSTSASVYSFTTNIEKYDKYLFDWYLMLHPIRFGLTIGTIFSADEKNQIITDIHERANQFRDSYNEMFSGETTNFTDVSFGQCTVVEDAKATYSNGNFYIVKGACSGLAASRGTGTGGLNIDFDNRLDSFLTAAATAGYSIGITDYWRSYSAQVTCYQNKPDLCAYPGRSMHGWGIAADLNYHGNSRATAWAHANASKYNLDFAVCTNYFAGNCKEPWHIQADAIIRQ